LKEKEAVIEHYSTLLDAEVIESFKTKIDEMTKEELDKELAYVLVQSQPTLFTHKENDPGYVPKEETPLSGIEGILTRYKNK
jgi:thioredoxin-related protein